MKAVAVYTRVSTEDQAASGLGLTDQIQRCRAYVSALGLADGSEVRVFTDEGASGGSMDRDALSEVLGAMRRREIGAVVVLKLDRLTRSVRDLLTLVETAERYGVALHSVSERIDTGSAAGRLMLTVLGAVSEWERDAIAERTRAAVRVKRSQGRAHGFAPLGARKVADRLEAVAGEVEAIDLMRRRRAAGASYRAIASELQEREFKTKRGGQWAAGTVHRVLTRIDRDGFVAGVEVAA